MANKMEKVTKSAEAPKEVIKEEIKKSEPVVNGDSEIETLRKQVELLQALVLQQATQGNSNSQNSDGYIRADKSIKVMSLTSNQLNLSTMGGGKGKPFVYKQYGDVKNIIYSDLAEILHHYQKFAEQGAFYIFDVEVIKRHGLEDVYNTILDKKAIDSFLEKDADEIKAIYKELPQIQQETIAQIVIKKIVNGEDISTNKVNAIKEIYGQDIFAMADEYANWEKEVEDLEK